MQGSKRDIEVKNRLLGSVGEGEGGTIWENSWNMYITICKTDDQCKFKAWSRVLKAGALDNPVGWGGGGGGRCFRMGDTCVPMADSWWCIAKEHPNIVK